MTKEQIIVNNLKGMSEKKLVELWNEVDKKEVNLEVAKVRGWLMEALEAKNPEAFDAWMEDYESIPEKHFLV